MNKEKIFEWVKKEYGTEPEYLWKSTPDAAVLRHRGNRKWYGLVMSVRRNRLGLPGDDTVWILNVKTDPLMTGSLLMKKGIFPAYHMNKRMWVTILLDGTVEENDVFGLLSMSYNIISAKKQNNVSR